LTGRSAFHAERSAAVGLLQASSVRSSDTLLK